MKTLLVTTDLSKESLQAFGPAVELAQALDAKVVLLSVVEDPARAAIFYATDLPILPEPGLFEKVIQQLKTQLNTLLTEHLSLVKAEAVVREAQGAIYQEIISYAEQIDAGMIIIATHGRTGLKHLLLGSTAERIARESTRPVLVIPSKGKY